MEREDTMVISNPTSSPSKTARDDSEIPLVEHPAFCNLKVPIRLNNGSTACRNLSLNENNLINKIVGDRRQVIASSVAQLFWTDPIKHNEWMIVQTGVVCYVKDYRYKSYFIYMIDFKEKFVAWQQEIYTQFEYHTPKEQFHTFEGDRCQVALNFYDIDEATWFRDCVRKRIAYFKAKKQEAHLQKVLKERQHELDALKSLDDNEILKDLLKEKAGKQKSKATHSNRKRSKTRLIHNQNATSSTAENSTNVDQRATKMQSCFPFLKCWKPQINNEVIRKKSTNRTSVYKILKNSKEEIRKESVLETNQHNKVILENENNNIERHDAPEYTLNHIQGSHHEEINDNLQQVNDTSVEENKDDISDDEEEIHIELHKRARRSSSVGSIRLSIHMQQTSLRSTHSAIVLDEASSVDIEVPADREDLLKSLLRGIQLRKVPTEAKIGPKGIAMQNELCDILSRALDKRKKVMIDASDEDWEDDDWDDSSLNDN